MEDKQTDSDGKKNRNILDMLKDDQGSGSKKNWKAFRDKIRLKRAGKAWKSSLPVPASDIPMENKTNRMMIRRGSARYPSDTDAEELDGEATRQLGYMPERQRSIRLLPVETDPEEEEEGDRPSEDNQKQEDGKGDQPISLMTLLSDTGSNYVDDPEEHGDGQQHDEEPNDDDHEEEDIGDCNVCCGCKGKHKGAALGPCGHTFCKHCTKELHVSRGNCPTCNDFILEILDIY